MVEPPTGGGSARLGELVDAVRTELQQVHEAREVALRSCRVTIQACGRAIRAIHRSEAESAASLLGEAEAALREARSVVGGHPAIAGAGFLHDAEKEYAEASLLEALVSGGRLPGHADLGVGVAAWCNGLAEAASELRRHLLDRLRAGDLDRAEVVLSAMDDVYGVLITVDFPDAITGGLRRTTDAFRAVLERTRSDLTTTALQARLQAAIERRLPAE